MDPRLAGIGATLAGIGLYGFSLIGYDDVVSAGPPSFGLGVEASYVTDLLPWILVMSFGMGMVFVPLTITAVHGVGARDSGIGSGVLNAMQQVGGSLGLAISTVAVSSAKDKATEIGATAQATSPRARLPRRRTSSSSSRTPSPPSPSPTARRLPSSSAQG